MGQVKILMVEDFRRIGKLNHFDISLIREIWYLHIMVLSNENYLKHNVVSRRRAY